MADIPSRSATWSELSDFCAVDEWTQIRTETGHRFWEKVLATGEVLQTHQSYTGSDPSQQLFSRILRDQLRVSRREFWTALQTGQPVDRPVPELEPAPPEYPAYVVSGLLARGLTEDQIRLMTPEEAEAKLVELWSTPR